MVAAIQVITVPIFARHLGVHLYGEWLILSAVPAYLALTDFGLLGAASNDITALMARGQPDEARDVLRTVWGTLTIVSVIVATAAMLLTEVLDIHAALGLEDVAPDEAQRTMLLLVGWTMLLVHNAVPEATWRAAGRYATGTTLSAAFRLFDFSVAAVIVVLTAQIQLVATGLLITRSMTLGLNVVLVSRACPMLTLGFRGVSRAHLRRLAGPALCFALFPIGNALTTQGSVLVVGTVLGPIAVVVLTATRTVTNLLKQVLQLPGNAVWPELTVALSTGARDTALQLTTLLRDIAVWSGAAIPALAVVPLIVKVWAGEAAEPDVGLALALGVAVWIENVWWSLSLVPLSVNLHQKVAAAYALAAVIGVSLSALAVHAIDLYAIPLSLVLVHGVVLTFALKGSATVLMTDKLRLLIPRGPASVWRARLRPVLPAEEALFPLETRVGVEQDGPIQE